MTDCTGWHYEDDLPADYPYDREFPRSRVVDGVRMFPPATAITPEWLESVGFVVSKHKPIYWRFEIGDTWVAYSHADGRWWIDDVNWAGIAVPNINTRDDVRALVRMLGGELNESEGD